MTSMWSGRTGNGSRKETPLSDADAAVIEACEAGGYGSVVAAELLRLTDLFADYGVPAVFADRGTGHLTWRVGSVSLTLSVGDAGFWGFSLLHVGGLCLTAIGRVDDKESVIDFRWHCVTAAAYLAAAETEVVTPKRKRRKK